MMVYYFVVGKIKLHSTQSGVAGEYLTAGELSRLGFLAAITLRNAKGVDIIATNATATRSVAIQVKSRYSRGRCWVMNEKAERNFSENFFYVFVALNDGLQPADFHVVPSKIVAETIKQHNREWLNTPGQKGQKRNQTTMRTFWDQENKYKGAWDLLGL
jgi:hypothetical protein